MSLSINPAAIGCTLFGSGRRYSDGYTWLQQLTITSRSKIVSFSHSFEGRPILAINYFSDCRGSQSKGGSAYTGITGDNGIILNGFLQQSFEKIAFTPSVFKMGSYTAAITALSAALSASPYILQTVLTYDFGICRCPDGSTPPPLLTPRIYFGNASPPPPPPKNMNCCDCNTIASIVENQSIVQLVAQQKLFEDLKDHIDKRSLEIIIKDLEHLKALNFEQFLKAIMQRINESESNLWNGPQQ